MQSNNSGTSGRSDADEMCELFIPGKMIVPSVLAWMVEGDDTLIIWIRGFDLVVFVAIATGTGERQILRCRDATTYGRHNMLDRKRLGSKSQWAETVFAPVRGTTFNFKS